MIVQMWEARIKPGLIPEWIEYCTETLIPRLRGFSGFRGASVFSSFDEPPRIVVISRWDDEQALEAAYGANWRCVADFAPEEMHLHARPPFVWNFVEQLVIDPE